LAGGGIEGGERGVGGAGIYDKKIIDDERSGAHSPGWQLGFEFAREVALPDEFAICDVDAAKDAESAEEVGAIAVDDGSGAGGVAEIEFAGGGKVDAPKGLAVFGIEATINVVFVSEVAFGADEAIVADGESGESAFDGGFFPENFCVRGKA